MPVDHPVGSVEEAVALAEEWRAAGTRTWFRGQAQPWLLVTSLGRVQDDASAVEDAEARIARAAEWMAGVPELAHLLEEQNVHAFFAVLQHYGLKTPYVDFTTEPQIAAFFAVHDEASLPGIQGCIIAIDPDDFVEMTRICAEALHYARESWPERVVVEVDGLWRMQAQAGHLVYLPIGGIERFYGYDRILFPHDGRPHAIREDRIYPIDKSRLERLLDDFFETLRLEEHDAFLRDVFDQWRFRGIDVEWAPIEQSDPSGHLVHGATPHPSWSGVDQQWITASHDRYLSALEPRPELRLAVPGGECSELEESIAAQVLSYLRDGADRRASAVAVVLQADTSLPPDIELLLDKVWDGMRRLPYSDVQLAGAVARTATFLLDPGRHRHDETRRTLELGSPGRVSSRACAPRTALREAYREDLSHVLPDSDLAEHERLLTAQIPPPMLFRFDALVDLFAEEIIPSQVAEAPLPGATVFFSLAEVTTIGLP